MPESGFKSTADARAEVEETNRQLLLKLANMGVALDGATILSIRLDALLDMTLNDDERNQFELDFNLKFAQVLQQISREVTFSTGGLVLPK